MQARLLKERADNDKDRPQGGIENVSGRVRRPRPEQPQETGGGLSQHTVDNETRACEWPRANINDAFMRQLKTTVRTG